MGISNIPAGTLQLCRNLPVTLFLMSLLACGGSGSAVSTITDPLNTDNSNTNTNVDPNVPQNASGGGTINDPKVLDVGFLYNGSITANGNVYYKFTTGDLTTTHEISVMDETYILTWNLFSDAAFTTEVDACIEYYWYGTCSTDMALAPNTTYYLRVNEETGLDDTYTIRVSPNIIREGTSMEPVTVTPGVSYTGMALEDDTADTGPYYGESSYYSFTTGDTDSVYTISLSGAESDLKWALYTGTSRSGGIMSCDTTWAVGDETCVTPTLTAGTTYVLQVMNYDAAGTLFTLDINAGGTAAAPAVDDGSVASPVVLQIGVTHTGTVSPAGTTHYTFTPNNTAFHAIKLERIPTYMEVSIYRDAAYTDLIDTATWFNHYYEGTWLVYDKHFSAATTYYVAVTDLASNGGSFNITVLEDELRNVDSEGTRISPVQLTLGVIHSGKAGLLDESFYQFTATEPKPYRISVTNPTTNVNWYSYFDGWFTSTDSCNAAGTGLDEICVTKVYNAGHTYNLRITESSGDAAATYDVLVEMLDGPGEGTSSTPLALSPGVAHNGSVRADSTSYYQFTTGADPAAHLISVTTISANVDWYLYDSPSGGSQIAYSSKSGTTDDIYTSGLLQANTTYYIRVRQQGTFPAVDATYSIMVDSGTPRTPLTLDTPLAETPTTGESRAYYSFTTDGVNTDYTISMSYAGSGNILWILYSDADQTTSVLTCDSTFATSGQSCVVSGLTINTTYYLYTYNQNAEAYTIAVYTGSFNLGSAPSPIDLLGVPVTAFDGTVGDNGASYYKFTTAGGGGPQVHRITYTLDTQVYLRVYPDTTFTTQVGPACLTSGTAGFCDTPVSLSQGTTYYLMVDEQDGYAGNFNLSIDVAP